MVPLMLQGVRWVEPTVGNPARYGGTAEASVRANEGSWRKATALLDRALKHAGGSG